jgi:hypothetical protein
MASQKALNQDTKVGDNPEQMITERRKDYILHTPAAQPVSNSSIEDAPNPPHVLELRGDNKLDGTKVGDNPEYMTSKRIL